MRIEVCVDNISALRELASYNIDRVEICSALELDGLTPSIALVKYARKNIDAQCHIMLRPRSGNFNYNDLEFFEIQKTLEEFAQIGIHGIVFGCLTKEFKINVDQVGALVRYARIYNLETTFHRAIDISSNYFESIETCVNLGINRILTSGGEKKAISGLENIEKAVSLYGNKIQIMAGSGINAHNVDNIVNIGVNAIHFSASKLKYPTKDYGRNILSKASSGHLSIDKEKLEQLFSILT